VKHPIDVQKVNYTQKGLKAFFFGQVVKVPMAFPVDALE
jgi:hypothetical protein